jgi:hypothetical protein
MTPVATLLIRLWVRHSPSPPRAWMFEICTSTIGHSQVFSASSTGTAKWLKPAGLMTIPADFRAS